MNLLDENIRFDQTLLLRKWRIHFKTLAKDLGAAGIKDPNVLPLLHSVKHTTFFTHDRDYFHFDLTHPAYCLVWLDSYDGLAAEFIRKFLRHPQFKTQAQRMGLVVRVHPDGIRFWKSTSPALQSIGWPRQ